MSEDAELLRRYAADHSEAAFSEFIRRHVDLVYSAAVRLMNGDVHQAQDVTQQVFSELARQARHLTGHPTLTGWLYTTTRRLSWRVIRSEQRRKTREREANTTNELLREPTPEPDWDHLRPVLEDAMHKLGDKDRLAVLLRFFQKKSLSEVGATLGLSENAARMRVERALDKLRAQLALKGVTSSAAALALTLSGQAVTAAPPAFVATLTSASLASAAAGSGTTFTLLKFMVMTKLKLAIISAVVVASVAMPCVVHHQAQIKLQARDGLLRQRVVQLAQLASDNQRLSNLLAQAKSSGLFTYDQFRELLRRRGEVGRLRRDVQEMMQLKTATSVSSTDALASAEKVWSGRVTQLKQWLEVNPSEKIQELQFLTEDDWLDSIHPLTLDIADEYSRAMSTVRANAELRIMDLLGGALRQYVRENNGQFPADLSQLEPYLKSPIDDAILQRYQIVAAANLVSELQGHGDWVITQKAPVNEALDARFAFGPTSGGMADCRVTNRWVLAH
jgi:RNA polymerase sigma factor (sigma-70 family)